MPWIQRHLHRISIQTRIPKILIIAWQHLIQLQLPPTRMVLHLLTLQHIQQILLKDLYHSSQILLPAVHLICMLVRMEIHQHNRTIWTHLPLHSFNARSTGRCSAETSPRCFQNNINNIRDFSHPEGEKQRSVRNVLKDLLQYLQIGKIEVLIKAIYEVKFMNLKKNFLQVSCWI